jgi:hypothetical protein
MGAPVVHFEIMGAEGNQLERFYAELFGWKIDSNNPMKYGVVDTEAELGGINGGVGPAKDGSKRVSIYVQVKDLQATLDWGEAGRQDGPAANPSARRSQAGHVRRPGREYYRAFSGKAGW